MSTTKIRRRAFTTAIVVTLAAFVTLLGRALSMVVIGWLPADTLQTILDPSAPAHRFHTLGIGWLFAIPLVGVLVQLRKPASKTAPMQQTLFAALVINLIAAITGTFSADGVVFIALIAAAAFLHPRWREVGGLGNPEVSTTGLAGVAAIPFLLYALDHIRLQRLDAPGDFHAVVDHWALMASLAVVIVGTAFIGSGNRNGWRISAWTAGLATMVFGVASLLYPNVASGASAGWAATAIIWAIVYLIATERRQRQNELPQTSEPDSAEEPAQPRRGS